MSSQKCWDWILHHALCPGFFCSIWGRCSRSPLCVRVRYFEGLSILQLAGSSSNEVLANNVQDSLRAHCHRTVPNRCHSLPNSSETAARQQSSRGQACVAPLRQLRCLTVLRIVGLLPNNLQAHGLLPYSFRAPRLAVFACSKQFRSPLRACKLLSSTLEPLRFLASRPTAHKIEVFKVNEF